MHSSASLVEHAGRAGPR